MLSPVQDFTSGVSVLQNDFTPEEEEEVRRENQWAFE